MRTSTITKKIARIFLSILFIFTLSTSAFAADTPQPRIDFVATMDVVSFSGGGSFSSTGYKGHSFLIFKNTSNSNITIGHMPVAPGESITIGTFGNRSAHSGIWYNIEGYHGVSSTSYGLRTGLTTGQLLLVNQEINGHDSWSLSNNCSAFARDVWNAADSGNTLSGGNPAALASSIKKCSGYTTNPTIPSKSLNSIARHTSSSYSYDASGANPG